VIYPLFVQVVRHIIPNDTPNEKFKKVVTDTQRTFQLYTDPLQGLLACAQTMVVPNSDHISFVEWPVVDQGVRKFYIDWERMMSSVPESVTVEELRELALKTPALICSILQTAECIDNETEVTVIVKEATRSVKANARLGKTKYDTKVSMHFIFQVSLTYRQYEGVWALIEKYVSEQPCADTIFRCISATNHDRLTLSDLQTMGQFACMCGVDFSSRNNLMQVKTIFCNHICYISRYLFVDFTGFGYARIQETDRSSFCLHAPLQIDDQRRWNIEQIHWLERPLGLAQNEEFFAPWPYAGRGSHAGYYDHYAWPQVYWNKKGHKGHGLSLQKTDFERKPSAWTRLQKTEKIA
jgi:hypothetical protein